MSKIEAGVDTVVMREFDLVGTLKDVESLMRIRAEPKGLSLVVEHDATLPGRIRTDENKITQVLLNMLGNAVKYTDEGSVTLRVSAQAHEPTSETDKGVTLLFEIEDTGIGIPEEGQENIFDAFARVDREGRSQEGTGLGLAISKKNVDLLGGSIQVESVVGSGTKFSFTIDMENVGTDETESLEDTASAIGIEPGSVAPDGSQFRILVVDDHSENRMWLARLLKEAGFEVKEAENGRQGVDLNESFRPHLIWMDIRMPVMDGKEAVGRIRSKGVHGNQPVIIALSASAFEEEKTECLEAGCDDFVHKPANVDDIFGTMAQYLSVRYIRDNTRGTLDENRGRRPLTDLLSDIWSLPVETIMNLQEALEKADIHMVEDLIRTIGSQNAGLGEALEAYAKDYAYGEILEAVMQAWPDGKKE